MVHKNNNAVLWMGGLLLMGLLAVGSSGTTNTVTEVTRSVATPVAVAASSSETASTIAVSLATGATKAADAAAASSTGPGLEVVYETVNPSVVEVINLARAGRFSSMAVEQGLGSGFVWDEKGHIVTNQHVVDGASELQVVFSDGTRVEAELVGTDASSDLAVIAVDPDVGRFDACQPGRHGRGARGADGGRHRQPVRPPGHDDAGHRQRAGPHDRLAEQLQHRQRHPDRRGHQPGQLGRPAAERAGRR